MMEKPVGTRESLCTPTTPSPQVRRNMLCDTLSHGAVVEGRMTAHESTRALLEGKGNTYLDLMVGLVIGLGRPGH